MNNWKAKWEYLERYDDDFQGYVLKAFNRLQKIAKGNGWIIGQFSDVCVFENPAGEHDFVIKFYNSYEELAELRATVKDSRYVFSISSIDSYNPETDSFDPLPLNPAATETMVNFGLYTI